MAMTSTPAVQKLYDVCKKVFTPASVPLEAQVAKVRAVLGTFATFSLHSIKPQDLGLGTIDQHNRGLGDDGKEKCRPILSRYVPVISYLHLYECDLFSMGVFVLPASASIPLHNHPGMTVLSRLLYGSMHVRAYDWVDPHDEKLNRNPSIARQAKLVIDHVLGTEPNGTEPQQTSATEVLYPTSGGNIHAFTALTSCAVLDVLAPPYAPATGRHCTYYRITSHEGEVEASDQPGSIEWLEEFHPPDDFVVQRGIYRGPRIIPSRN
uniref:cysteine dioxygenase n=1 Tax=Physcomitrium patens TaxID=3218 RepID=A0A7I4E332_PHYPA